MRIVPIGPYVSMFGPQLVNVEERLEGVALLKGGGVPLRVSFEVSKPSSASLCLPPFFCVSDCLSLYSLFLFLPLPHACGSDVSPQILLQYDAQLLPHSLRCWSWIYPLNKLNKFVSCLFMVSTSQQQNNNYNIIPVCFIKKCHLTSTEFISHSVISLNLKKCQYIITGQLKNHWS